MKGRRSSLVTDGVVAATAALIGFRLGLVPIKDNSAFTHLATGIQMVAKGWLPTIPHVDPYSYTAAGHDWVVQSWMPAWIVGGTERAFGFHGVLLLSAVSFGLVAWLMVSLARTGSPARTAAIAALTFVIGANSWSPRPLMLGLICFALMILIVERHRPLWWLVPLGWVWVQSHGSFPLGAVFLGVVWLGSVATARDWRAAPREFRALAALVGGIVVGALNPLGPKLVVFPLTALSKREVFSHIAEWKALAFDSPEAALSIVGITVAVAICIRRRVRLRVALPVVVFALASWQARRNVPVLAIVLAWALSHALRVTDDEMPPPRLDPILGVAIAAVAVVFAVASLGEPALNTVPYPVASIRWAERHQRFASPHRVLSRDWVGNYIELRRGPSAEVFIDDRYDMYPVDVSDDYFELVHGAHPRLALLDKYRVDTLIWPRNHRLTPALRRAGWAVGFSEKLGEDWVVLIRPGA